MEKNVRPEFPGFIGSRKTLNDRVAVILAGGDGSRLSSLTRMIAGDERPKQFCPILDDRTLLEHTRRRVSLKIAPENTFFSLTKKHERFFKTPLWDARKSQLIVQPENKGTAPAILYSLMRLTNEDPNAAVAFCPSDHYFSDDESFMEHVESAFRSVEVAPSAVVLLGIEPEKPETSYGWIEPAATLFGGESKGISRVKRFWEKPSTASARMLMKQGGLWNSFVMIGRVNAFLEMFRKHLPDMFRMFDASKNLLNRPTEESVTRSVYDWLKETNFSSEVLEKATEDLMVMRVGDVGWCDCGEPHRVLGTLRGLGIKPEWANALVA